MTFDVRIEKKNETKRRLDWYFPSGSELKYVLRLIAMLNKIQWRWKHICIHYEKKIESHSRFFFPFRFKELEVICVIFVFLPICIFAFRLPICIINPLMRPAHQSNIFLSHLILLSIRFGCFISFKRKIWKLFIFFFSFRFNSWTGNACSYFDFISFRSLNSSSYLSFSISTFHFRYFLLI